MAEPFTESWLYAELPIITSLTLYTRYGDYLGKAFVLAAIILLLFCTASYIMTLPRYRKH
jgi:apolipoprotein N-acyltransferase